MICIIFLLWSLASLICSVHIFSCLLLQLFVLFSSDGEQVIFVYSAQYGRRDQTTCSYQRPANELQNVHCSRPTSKVAARYSCPPFDDLKFRLWAVEMIIMQTFELQNSDSCEARTCYAVMPHAVLVSQMTLRFHIHIHSP